MSLQHLCTWHSVDNVIILATVNTVGDRETEVTQNHAQFQTEEDETLWERWV